MGLFSAFDPPPASGVDPYILLAAMWKITEAGLDPERKDEAGVSDIVDLLTHR